MAAAGERQRGPQCAQRRGEGVLGDVRRVPLSLPHQLGADDPALWTRAEDAAAFTMSSEVQGVVGILGDQRRDRYLSEQFASLVTSVEVGLEQFRGQKGRGEARHGDEQAVHVGGAEACARAAMSFVRADDQPTELIASLIGEADNARVEKLTVVSAGAGYTAVPPSVTIERPPTSTGLMARAR